MCGAAVRKQERESMASYVRKGWLVVDDAEYLLVHNQTVSKTLFRSLKLIREFVGYDEAIIAGAF